MSMFSCFLVTFETSKVITYMANSYFQFKQFKITQDKCAMKVGTDGVLLGAWAPVDGACNILDIGTGTGVIALMLAQRCASASIEAIDIEAAAVLQAGQNVADSPWADRVRVSLQDVRTVPEFWKERFDCIVSNPPYFVGSLGCPDPSRMLARHTAELDFHALAAAVAFLLSGTGTFSVVLPADAYSSFVGVALHEGLFLQRVTWVHTKPDIPAKRVLMSFTRKAVPVTHHEHLVVEISRHVYSPEYVALLKDFYLKL